jgi:TonB family protein
MAKSIGLALGVVAVISLAAVARDRSTPQQMPRDRTPTEQRSSERSAFERKVAELERAAAARPADAAAQHVIATFYYEKTRDQSLSADDRREYIARGLEAEERALQIKPDYIEALVYKNILLRTKAVSEPDPAAKEALIREADGLRNRAMQLQSTRAAEPIPEGTVVTPGPPPPPPPPPPGGTDGPIKWVYADTNFTAAGTAPVRTKDVRPIFAPMVIASGVKGEVVVEANVDARGRVGQLKVVKSQPMLTQATIDAVRQWEFDPATVAAGGSTITVTANFTPPSR